jgi:hypothetical protein
LPQRSLRNRDAGEATAAAAGCAVTAIADDIKLDFCNGFAYEILCIFFLSESRNGKLSHFLLYIAYSLNVRQIYTKPETWNENLLNFINGRWMTGIKQSDSPNK